MSGERIVQRKESRELLGEGGRLPVASARHLAGVEGAHFTRPGSELAQHREKHAQHLREVTTLDHSHVRSVSTQERLQRNPVTNPAEIAQRNREWGQQLKTWLEAAPEDVRTKVKDVYHLNVEDPNILGRIEQFRSYYFDYDRPAGEVNERAVIDDLVYRHNNSDDIVERNALPLDQVVEDLQMLQSFLHLFGGEATVAHITHAALAEAALAEAPEVGEPEREKFVKEMLSLVEKNMPENDAKHYNTIHSDTIIVMATPPDGELTGVPDAAPIDGEIREAAQGGEEEHVGHPARREGAPPVQQDELEPSVNISPISEEEQSRRGWHLFVDGREIPTVSSVKLRNPKMDITAEYGKTEAGYDGLVLEEPGGGGSVIVPFAIIDGELYIGAVEENRPNMGGKVLNVPRGFLDPGEVHFETAQRELREEAGYQPLEERIQEIGKGMNPNSTFFVTKGDDKGVQPFAVRILPEEIRLDTDSDNARERVYTFNPDVVHGVSKTGEKVMKSQFIHWTRALGLKDMFTVAAVGRLVIDKISSDGIHIS